MCLDPRPDSIVRVRPSATRTHPAPRPDGATHPATHPAAHAATHAATHAARTTRPETRDTWLGALTDSLDARGWTLVTRTVASC